MKNNRSVSIAVIATVVVFAIASCSKVASILTKNLSFSTTAQPFNIPPVPTAIALSTGIMPTVKGSFSYNLDSLIKASTNNALGVNSIGSLKIANCTMTVTNPTDSSNFQDFKSVTITFTSASTSATYQLTVNQADTFSSTMILTPVDTTADLKAYLQGNTFNYSVDGVMRRGTTDTMKCNAVFTFTLKVQG